MLSDRSKVSIAQIVFYVPAICPLIIPFILSLQTSSDVMDNPAVLLAQ